ncbi:MAG: sodium:solute symporter family protein [Lentisphaerae bacterium]|nr:sodium:solute symporter family protein [Lentisphaerota bacterium]
MNPTFQPVISFADAITPLDWAVFIVVQIATVGAVIYGHRRKRQTVAAGSQATFLDLMLMGRQLTLPLFVATLVATWYGGILGVTEIAFNFGIFNFVTQGIFWYLAYLLFAFFLVNRISRYQAITLPELVENMFGPRSGRLSAIFNFFNVLPVAYAISIGLFLQVILGGSLLTMMILGLLPLVLYTMWGGFRAVVFSDLVQFGVMCSAVALVFAVSVLTFGGLPFLHAHLPAAHFSVTGGNSWGTTFVWGFVALATLVDPSFYQRCFAAQSARVARRGIIISTVIWFGFDICTTAGGMYARAVIPAAEAKQAYLIYAMQLLPPGLRGFMLAGVAATILSTLDAFLFIAGNTVSYDLVPKRWKGRVDLQRAGIVVAAVASIGLALVFDGSIREAWKTLGSYAAACLLLPVMVGHVWPGRIRDNQFVIASLCGVVGTTAWRLIDRTGFWAEVDALYIGAACTAAGLALYAIARPHQPRPS